MADTPGSVSKYKEALTEVRKELAKLQIENLCLKKKVQPLEEVRQECEALRKAASSADSDRLAQDNNVLRAKVIEAEAEMAKLKDLYIKKDESFQGRLSALEQQNADVTSKLEQERQAHKDLEEAIAEDLANSFSMRCCTFLVRAFIILCFALLSFTSFCSFNR